MPASPSIAFNPAGRIQGAVLAFAVTLASSLATATAPATPNIPPPVPGKLTLHEGAGVFVIQYGGKPGKHGGIPSWKGIIEPDNGGNLSALHIPADHPESVGSRDAHDPFTMISGRNGEGLVPTLWKGREHYVGIRPETFEWLERSPERMVLHIGGPSKNKFYIHDRVYTFTPAGVQIEGWIDPLVNLEVVSFMPHWDRRQIADSHTPAMPLRTQGRHGWIPMPSSGQDGSSPLPAGADFPLEMELKLRRPTPTFVRVFFDQPFDAAAGTKRFVHNNKDIFLIVADRVLYEKLTGITGFPVPKGARQNYKARFVFETQSWPDSPARSVAPSIPSRAGLRPAQGRSKTCPTWTSLVSRNT